MNIKYYMPTETARKFHESKNPVRVLVGPMACGRTVAALMDLVVNPVPEDGVVLLVRNTDMGFRHGDGHTLEQWFGDDDLCDNLLRNGLHQTKINGKSVILQLLSLNHNKAPLKMFYYSRAIIFNAETISDLVIDMICSNMTKLAGCEDPSVVFDYSGFENWHEIEKRFARDEIFWYPSAYVINETGDVSVNPKAENIHNLPNDYYKALISRFCKKETIHKFVRYYKKIKTTETTTYHMVGE